MTKTTGTSNPKAWIDKNYVTCFRRDITVEEAQELGDMISHAFNAGLVSGYQQGREAASKP
jgi:hypothetical protein